MTSLADLGPTYADLVNLLRRAPPREMITDQRYWDWRRQVEEMLAWLDAVGSPPH